MRETTSNELARVGREAAQVPPLRQEVSSMREELLQADVHRNEMAMARAAAERESSRLLKQNGDLQQEALDAKEEVARARARSMAAEAAAERAKADAAEAEAAAEARVKAAEAKAAAAARAQAHAEAMAREAEEAAKAAARAAAARASWQPPDEPPDVMPLPQPVPQPVRRPSSTLHQPTRSSQQWSQGQPEKRAILKSQMVSHVPQKPAGIAGRSPSGTFGGTAFLQDPSLDAGRFQWGQGRSFADARREKGFTMDLSIDTPTPTSAPSSTPSAPRQVSSARRISSAGPSPLYSAHSHPASL